jgi:transketolase
MAALAFHRLGRVVVTVDVNGYQCDGAMDTVMRLEPLADRLRAFGAAVAEVDGHDVDALTAATSHPDEERPLVVLARTDACRGMALLRERAPPIPRCWCSRPTSPPRAKPTSCVPPCPSASCRSAWPSKT